MVRIFTTAMLLIIVISCKKENPVREHRNIAKVEGPASGIPHQAIKFMVHYPASNGCEVIDGFEEIKQGMIITIKAFGYSSTGICTMEAGIKKKDYSFIPTSTGIFEFRFITRDNSIISHFVTIN